MGLATQLAWTAVVALVLFVIWVQLSPPDVDPFFTVQQSSASTVRLPGESAVYRSRENEHGRPLIGSYETGKFSVQALWEPESFKIFHINQYGNKAAAPDVASTVKKYGTVLQALTNSSETKSNKVLITLNAGLESLYMLFACVRYGLHPVFVNSNYSTELQDAITLIRPAVVVGATNINELDLCGATPLATSKSQGSISSVDDLQNSQEGAVTTDTPEIAFSFVGSANSVFHVSQKEVGRALIAQLRAPHDRQWTPSDRVLLFDSHLTPYSLLMQLASLSCKAEIVFVDRGIVEPFKAVKTARPTIIVTEDIALRTLASRVDDFSLPMFLRYAFSLLWLRRGNLSRALLPEFNSVRTIVTTPSNDVENGILRPEEINKVRILVGAQVLHTLELSNCFIPVAQTTPGDYSSGHKLRANFGGILPGIEVKVVGPNANKGQGALSYRYDQEWVQTHLEVEMTKGGCVQLKLADIKEVSPFYIQQQEFGFVNHNA